MAFRDVRRHPFATGYGLGCAMLTGVGAVVALIGRDVVGGALVLLSFVALVVGVLVAARLRKPGEPL
jgi:hypothetical protein